MNQKIEYMKMDKQMVYLLVAGIVWVLRLARTRYLIIRRCMYASW